MLQLRARGATPVRFHQYSRSAGKNGSRIREHGNFADPTAKRRDGFNCVVVFLLANCLRVNDLNLAKRLNGWNDLNPAVLLRSGKMRLPSSKTNRGVLPQSRSRVSGRKLFKAIVRATATRITVRRMTRDGRKPFFLILV